MSCGAVGCVNDLWRDGMCGVRFREYVGVGKLWGLG